MKKEDLEFMKIVLEMAENNVKEGRGGPFAAIIVKDGKIVGKGTIFALGTKRFIWLT